MATSNLGLTTINSSDYVDVDVFNDNYALLDKLGVDYVTAKGTSGNWTYRKWKSGVAECWETVTGTTNSTGLFHTTASFPFTFSSAPVVQASGYISDQAYSSIYYTKSATTTVDVYLQADGVTAATSCGVYIFAAGKYSS